MRQENGLQYILFLVDEQWEEEKNVLKESLEREGIGCLDVEKAIDSLWIREIQRTMSSVRMQGMGTNTASAGVANKMAGESHDECDVHRIEGVNKKRCIFLTDRKAAAREAAEKGIACIGLNRNLNCFFEGAVLVCDSLDSLDVQTLEETYLRAKGLPVTIAETERLVLREIAIEDIEELCRISQMPGMEYLMPEGKAAETFFNEENLRGYIDTVYRFYGYGLWSVWKKDGTLIGCCGLQDYIAEREHIAEQECEMEQEKNEEIQEFVLQLSGEVTECGFEPAGHGGKPAEYRTESAECGNEPEVHGAESAECETETEELEKESAEDQQETLSEDSCLELQYMLAPQYQHQGFGTEMCRAALGFAFARTDAQQIYIRCHRENKGAIALAKKLLEWRPFSV